MGVNLRSIFIIIAVLIAAGVGAASSVASEFQCTTEPCRVTLKPDGTGKTAHQVLKVSDGVNSGSITCDTISGEATSATKEAVELTFSNLQFGVCQLAGSSAIISANGCHFLYTSTGMWSTKCPTGKEMLVTAGSCSVSIPPQGPLSGITYHAAEPPSESKTTVSTAVKSIKATASGCAGLGLPNGEFSKSEYTTGNLIMESEPDPPPPPTAYFHCSVSPCEALVKPDGSIGKEKHHVLAIKKGATSMVLTCEQIAANVVSAFKTTTEGTVSNIVYTGCSGSFISGWSVQMNGCDYHFSASGEASLKCPVGKEIEISAVSCVIRIPSQGPFKSIAYTNLSSKNEITASAFVNNIKVTSSGCATFGLPDGEYNESEYTTGNAIVYSPFNSVWWE